MYLNTNERIHNNVGCYIYNRCNYNNNNNVDVQLYSYLCNM